MSETGWHQGLLYFLKFDILTSTEWPLPYYKALPHVPTCCKAWQQVIRPSYSNLIAFYQHQNPATISMVSFMSDAFWNQTHQRICTKSGFWDCSKGESGLQTNLTLTLPYKMILSGSKLSLPFPVTRLLFPSWICRLSRLLMWQSVICGLTDFFYSFKWQAIAVKIEMQHFIENFIESEHFLWGWCESALWTVNNFEQMLLGKYFLLFTMKTKFCTNWNDFLLNLV